MYRYNDDTDNDDHKDKANRIPTCTYYVPSLHAHDTTHARHQRKQSVGLHVVRWILVAAGDV